MEVPHLLAFLDTSIGGGSVALDVLFLVIVMALIVGAVRIAHRLTTWSRKRFERRAAKRRTGESARTDSLRNLGELRDLGSLSEEEFEAAKTRVRGE